MAYNRAMAVLVGVMDAAALEAKQEKLFSILGGNGPRHRGVFGRDRFGLSGLGSAPRAGFRNAIAITADSASIPESHKRDAEAFARRFADSGTSTSRRMNSTIPIT